MMLLQDAIQEFAIDAVRRQLGIFNNRAKSFGGLVLNVEDKSLGRPLK